MGTCISPGAPTHFDTYMVGSGLGNCAVRRTRSVRVFCGVKVRVKLKLRVRVEVRVKVKGGDRVRVRVRKL